MNLNLSVCLWPGDEMERLLVYCPLQTYEHLLSSSIEKQPQVRIFMDCCPAILERKRCLAGWFINLAGLDIP